MCLLQLQAKCFPNFFLTNTNICFKIIKKYKTLRLIFLLLEKNIKDLKNNKKDFYVHLPQKNIELKWMRVFKRFFAIQSNILNSMLFHSEISLPFHECSCCPPRQSIKVKQKYLHLMMSIPCPNPARHSFLRQATGHFNPAPILDNF